MQVGLQSALTVIGNTLPFPSRFWSNGLIPRIGALVVAGCAIRFPSEDVKPLSKLKSVIHDSLSLVRLLRAEIQK